MGYRKRASATRRLVKTLTIVSALFLTLFSLAIMYFVTGLNGQNLARRLRSSASETMGETGARIYWGAYIRGDTYGMSDPPWNPVPIDRFEANAGKRISILHTGLPWYSSVSWPQGYYPFVPSIMDTIRSRGGIPFVDWASRDSNAPNILDQPTFNLSSIIRGDHDQYVRDWATGARNWGHPFFLRFDWEMNGWWYPWAEGKKGTSDTIVNGNNPGDYVKMWRHVHDIFEEVGATNVTWVWCINHMSDTTSGSHPPMSQIYPGDDYVDWISFDVYNRHNGWESFNTMVTGTGTNWLLNTYQSLLDTAPSKPIMIAEFGTKEDLTIATRKADWLTDALLTQIPVNFPQVKAIVYFNWNMTTDPNHPDSTIAIESSTYAQNAFGQGIASPHYASNTFADLPNGPIQPLQDVSPTETPTPSPSPTPTPTPEVNLLQNGSFEKTGTGWLAPWTLSVKPGAAGSVVQDSSTYAHGSYSAKVTTTNTGGVWWYISLAQPYLTFTAGRTYTITFWAKASTPRTTRVIIQKNYSPYTEYLKNVINLTTSWQKYTLSFTPTVTDTNMKFSFSAADSTGTLWIDEVTVH